MVRRGRVDESSRTGIEGLGRGFDILHPPVSAEVSALGTGPSAQLIQAILASAVIQASKRCEQASSVSEKRRSSTAMGKLANALRAAVTSARCKTGGGGGVCGYVCRKDFANVSSHSCLVDRRRGCGLRGRPGLRHRTRMLIVESASPSTSISRRFGRLPSPPIRSGAIAGKAAYVRRRRAARPKRVHCRRRQALHNPLNVIGGSGQRRLTVREAGDQNARKRVGPPEGGRRDPRRT